MTCLTDRFADALIFAEAAHRTQVRKGANVPYVAHLLAVTALVLEYGGDEDQAIAALLHDAVEDQGGAEMARTVEARFGPRVARIVLACTDFDSLPRPPWRVRKEAYIAGIAEKPAEALIVTMADKLHNATCIVADHHRVGKAVWSRFTAAQADTLWYHRALADALSLRAPGPLAERLAAAVAEMEALAA